MARLGAIAKTLGEKPVGQMGTLTVLFKTPDGILGPIYGDPASRGNRTQLRQNIFH